MGKYSKRDHIKFQSGSGHDFRLSWQTWQGLLSACCLVFLTFALYSPVLKYPFIEYDDGQYVYANIHMFEPLSWRMLVWAFTHTYAFNYDPLIFLVHRVNVQMFGLNPGLHHLANVVFHSLNALVLFWILKRATGFTGRSFVVAALFAVHPVNVENVAWIAELKTMLSGLFFLLALGVYRWYARNPRPRRMAVVILLYGLGLLAKPQVITLPLVLLLWDYWPLRRMFTNAPSSDETLASRYLIQPTSFARLIKEKIPLFVIAVADAVLTMFAEHKLDATPWPYTFAIRCGNAVLSYGRYIGKAFWPDKLAFIYPYPSTGIRWGEVLAALAVLVFVTVVVFGDRKRRYLVVGWLWFLVSLLPMINIVQIADPTAMADRYAYLAYIGLFLMVCWGVADWAAAQPKVPKLVLPLAAIAVLAAVSAVTRNQLRYWENTITLWTHTINVTQHNWVAHWRFGDTLRNRGQRREALSEFYQAVEDQPRSFEINLDIALTEHELGHPRQAIPYYEKVLVLPMDPVTSADVLSKLGRACSDLGEYERARQYYQAAATIALLPPPHRAVNWQGAWWRDIASLIRQHFRDWKNRIVTSR